MKLSKKQLLFISFMLFSMFFGAGNLIFPPFLGQNAGSHTGYAISTFLITAVLLPVLGVIVVAKFKGLEHLSSKVGVVFASIYTVLIYLSIGPGLGIPRAASVPFEMAIAPYLPKGASFALFMLLYSFIFFVIAIWLSLNPSKLVERMGKFLTPTLLTLILFLFISFLFRGESSIADAVGTYKSNALVVGFLEGYNTMDAIAALNFGLVISLTIKNLGVNEDSQIILNTTKAAFIAGLVLSGIYLILAFLGMSTSGLYPIQENGAWTLRYIVQDIYGDIGAVLLAAIFTIACLTTCVGLITSISQFFSKKFPKLSYRFYVFIITAISFMICNLGLNTILNISIPILNAIYPVSIVIMLMGLCDRWLKDNPYVYKIVILAVLIESILSSLDTIGLKFGIFTQALHYLPFYELGLGWVILVPITLFLSWFLNKVQKKYVLE